jgi:hypothetical protein
MKKLALALATVIVVAASPVYAAPLLFDFSGPSGTAIFQLDSSPTPDHSQTFVGSDQFPSTMSPVHSTEWLGRHPQSALGTGHSQA